MNFTDFLWERGDWLIHIRRGIGRYVGIQHVNAGGIEWEAIGLQFGENNTVWLPTMFIHEIAYYAHSSKDVKYGKHILKKIEECKKDAKVWLEFFIAQEKLRTSLRVEPMIITPSEYPYESLTDDQETCLEDIYTDLSSGVLMDRLICGDVCTGKTEIAIQSSRVILANKGQVVLLSPTTILTNQHFQEFVLRFPNKNVACVTRAAKDLQSIMTGCANGERDILITTHSIVRNPNWTWRDLKLTIIDEEHCFGIVDKERAKFANSHRLTMTATPLPRTAYMAINGSRGLSMLTQMPSDKKLAETYIVSDVDISTLIKERGQIMCVCRKIKDIPLLEEKIRKQLAENNIEIPIFIAHGQIPLEKIISTLDVFKKSHRAILISTALVGVGLDEESIHTLVVFDANNWGLSQLHQLRGRVSRSKDQGSAYFVSDTEGRPERLNLLQKYKGLGSGWVLSQKDMELRGTGSMLGTDQSGHVANIGLDLLNTLLGEIRQSLTLVDIHRFKYIIPADYILYEEERLYWYKYLAHIDSFQALERMRQKMELQHGQCAAMANCWKFIELRLQAHELGIYHIHGDDSINVSFYNGSKMRFDGIQSLGDLEKALLTIKNKDETNKHTSHTTYTNIIGMQNFTAQVER